MQLFKITSGGIFIIGGTDSSSDRFRCILCVVYLTQLTFDPLVCVSLYA